jgi:hypothetical protein
MKARPNNQDLPELHPSSIVLTNLPPCVLPADNPKVDQLEVRLLKAPMDEPQGALPATVVHSTKCDRLLLLFNAGPALVRTQRMKPSSLSKTYM